MLEINKNRNRSRYSFANINLLGKCNYNCYFCLGKDIEGLLSKHNQLQVPFWQWKNFYDFTELCRKLNIRQIYITGQNTDSLLYKYLDRLIDYYHLSKFHVGLRTNGLLAKQKMDIINQCTTCLGDAVSYTLLTLDPETNYKIVGSRKIPDWDWIFTHTKVPFRVAIVVNRYNFLQIENLLAFCEQYPQIEYIQMRKICTDTREEQLREDMKHFEELYDSVNRRYALINRYESAESFNIYNHEVSFWRTTQTTANSINYFTDGTISTSYFIIEGYLKNVKD